MAPSGSHGAAAGSARNSGQDVPQSAAHQDEIQGDQVYEKFTLDDIKNAITIPTSLKYTWNPPWGPREAFRELVQNWLVTEHFRVVDNH